MLLYFQPRLIAILFLGFASGLPLALTASTLSVWLAEAGVDKAAIGVFAAVAVPYSFKFLWAPLVDGFRLPVLCALFGRRRGWLFAIQALLAASLLLLGLADPALSPWATAGAALLVAFASATQDIVIDAYRVELLKPEEQGAGAAMVVLGYRFGMIASGAGALYLATYFSWFFTYAAMAVLVGIGTLAALFAGEPKGVARCSLPVARKNDATSWLREHVIAPFADFMTRPQWFTILLFVVLFKFADAFMGIMTNPFYIEMGFSKPQIAEVVKLYGLGATIAGSFIGGWLVARAGLLKSLWIGGILQGATNLVFIWLAGQGTDMTSLATVVTLENLSGGIGTAAFVAYISSLTHVRFTATQYALLSSFASFGRTILSTPAGWFAQSLGWHGFFTLSAALAIPGLLLLWHLERRQNCHKTVI